jgi:hypothetical protein
MIEGAWSRFLEFAAHARAKPAFDFEERQPKLAVAERIRGALEAARDHDADWPSQLREALHPSHRHPFESPRHVMVPIRQARWLNEWARRDPEALREPLLGFLDPGLEPLERFTQFAHAAKLASADRVQDERSMVLATEATLTMGSLLGFAVAPESLPIVREGHFRALRNLLGVETPPGDTPFDRYAAALDFTRQVQACLESHSVPITDMVDVQSLILIAVQEQVLWTEEPPADWATKASRGVSPDGVYLAACSVYLNEAPYLREWIEFHRLAGVERFFLYDNGSTDDHLDVLAPYIDEGVVVFGRWEASPLDQRAVFDHCLAEHREHARWIAFLDLDEFLFSPSGRTVSELLRGYEDWPGVGVSWTMFSHADHRTRPPGLVIESYPLRDRQDPGLVKSIVDPLRTVHSVNAHWFTPEYGFPVDENRWPLVRAQAKSASYELLRINHYASRSRQELEEKVERGSGWKHLHRWRRRDLEGSLDLVRDDVIMRWAPELRAALKRKR